MKQYLEALGLLFIFSLIVAMVSWLAPQTFYQTGLILGYFLYSITIIAPFLLPKDKGRGYFLTLLCLLILNTLLQTLVYYLSISLSSSLDGWTAILSAWILYGSVQLFPFTSTNESSETQPTFNIKTLILPLIGSIAIISFSYILLAQLLSVATTESIRSPWLIIPSGCLMLIGLTLFILQIVETRSPLFLTAGLTSALIFLVFSIAPIVYPLGFGFDGFLHRASEQVILNTGTLTPKPFYYIGQYTFVTWLVRLFDLPLKTIDTWFTVILATLLIPFTLSWKNNKTTISASIILLPLTGLIGGTPQASAYLIGICALLFAWNRLLIPSALFALWSLTIHPLAGIPFFFIVISLLSKQQRILKWASTALAIISIPAAFIFLSQRQSTPIVWHPESLIHLQAIGQILTSWLSPPLNHLALWTDWANWIQFLLFPFMLILSYRTIQKTSEEKSRLLPLIVGSIGIALAGLILKLTSEFSFLVDYERQNYIDRLFIIAQSILFVPASIGFKKLTQNFLQAPRLAILSTFALFSLMGAANIYNAYPKHDASMVGRGWSVSRHDIEAAQFIDDDAQGQPYTVLANQSVSAAAVEKLGFKRYANDVFFYPIPTGGKLYELYLNVTNPDASPTDIREIIKKTQLLGQTELVYVVLNKYWWNAEQVGPVLASIAEKTTVFGDNDDIVYRFTIPSNASNQ